jgi:hypothetical protein
MSLRPAGEISGVVVLMRAVLWLVFGDYGLAPGTPQADIPRGAAHEPWRRKRRA